ncbi:MAG: molecular chaperone TorD family protein [Nitrospirae bacterium YQR-1]
MNAVEYEKATAVVRSRVYDLLAAGFRQMSEEHFQELSAGHYISAWKEVVGYLTEGEERFLPLVDSLSEALKSSIYSNLYDEYNSLFLPYGRTHVSPYEMEIAKDTPHHSLTSQAELADVAGFYRAFGLDPSADVPERVDHIATELEFMHVMALKESVAVEEGDAEHIDIVRAGQQRFMTDHLGRWAAKFSDGVVESGTGSVYPTLAKMLRLWIGIDNAIFSEDTPLPQFTHTLPQSTVGVPAG